MILVPDPEPDFQFLGDSGSDPVRSGLVTPLVHVPVAPEVAQPHVEAGVGQDIA